ncbi:hypothetical protein [Streptomyces sp. NBC_01233]|uniref:hypothetical protein n=1 Tax=Streptomyces sp. NBC_01233 TaxID=2903787 RepID=UPI002E13C8C5|nr:hypothetical protein OG332_10500 [Streptomyces sp. NBC_01233]
MTHSPTPTELLALRTANAALLNSPDVYADFASTIVFALGSAQLLQSPETAAELDMLRARVSELETLTSALEIPRPGNAFPLLLQRIHGYADRWAICDRTGRRWTRHVGWCPEFGGSADEHLRDDARFTLAEALPLARRLAVEDPHDSLLHHTYRLGHDLPEVPHA